VLKSTRLQMIAMLAVGGLLGYGAASGKLDVFRKVNAGPPQESAFEKEASPVMAAAEACRARGSAKGQLVGLTVLSLPPRHDGCVS